MKIARLHQTLMVLLLPILGVGCQESAPSQSRESRIQSTTGFSLAPPSNLWKEEATNKAVLYHLKTDPSKATFFMGATEIRSPQALDHDSLMSFVSSKKKHWGDDGRYTHTLEEFERENEQPLCVRYRLYARDTKAKNKANHSHMVLDSVGRICRHPEDSHALMNIYYSIRHAPDFNPTRLVSQGEIFISSLRTESTQ